VTTRTVTTLIDMQPCPKCENRRDFKIVSERAGEDCCEVWVECKCGYAPEDCRFEDIWGGTGNAVVNGLLAQWNGIHKPEEIEVCGE